MLEQLEWLDARMKRMIPAPVVFALMGFAVAFMACLSFVFLGAEISRWVSPAVGIVGAIGRLGGRGFSPRAAGEAEDCRMVVCHDVVDRGGRQLSRRICRPDPV